MLKHLPLSNENNDNLDKLKSYVAFMIGNVFKLLLQRYTYNVETSLILCRKDCSLRKTMSAKFPNGGSRVIFGWQSTVRCNLLKLEKLKHQRLLHFQNFIVYNVDKNIPRATSYEVYNSAMLNSMCRSV